MNSIDKTNHKTVYSLFLPWQDKKEERWLEQMAAEGWLLTQYFFLRYDFIAIEPKEYVYRLDYKSTKDKDMEEYKEIFAQSGWEHVCSYFGWQYLRIPKDKFTTDIYTDKASQIEKLRRMSVYAMSLIMPIFILLVVFNIHSRAETAVEKYQLSFLDVLLTIIFILVSISIILNFIWLLKCSQRIKELENEQ